MIPPIKNEKNTSHIQVINGRIQWSPKINFLCIMVQRKCNHLFININSTSSAAPNMCLRNNLSCQLEKLNILEWISEYKTRDRSTLYPNKKYRLKAAPFASQFSFPWFSCLFNYAISNSFNKDFIYLLYEGHI